MKIAVFGLILAATLLVGAQVQAQVGFGGGMGAWWMDGVDAPAVGSSVPGMGFQGAAVQGATVPGMAFQGAGLASGTGTGLALGFGDGALPQPQDGTGFGSPLMR